jgi:hypothetical protein
LVPPRNALFMKINFNLLFWPKKIGVPLRKYFREKGKLLIFAMNKKM